MTRQRLSTPELMTIMLILSLASVLAVQVAREAMGQGRYNRELYTGAGARVITITPMELGLTYEEIGERSPGSVR